MILGIYPLRIINLNHRMDRSVEYLISVAKQK